MLSDGESQRSSPFPALTSKEDPLAMQFSRNPYKGKKPFTKCDWCGKGGHVQDDCYWLIGRPGQSEGTTKVHDDDIKKKQYPTSTERKPYRQQFDRKPFNSRFEKKRNFAVNNVTNDNRKTAFDDPIGPRKTGSSKQAFTDEQYRQLEQLYGRNGPRFSDEQYRQIQDLMNKKRESTDQHINLDLYSGRVRGIGREEGSLYIVKQSFKGDCFINSALKSTISTEKSISTKLWHQRLGHPSLQAMRMFGVVKRSQSDIVATKDCPICPLAKQSRLVFPCSVSRSTRTLALVHLDVWSPYKTPTHDRKHFFLTIVDGYTRYTWVLHVADEE